MSDATNTLYAEIIRYTVLNDNIGSADLAVLFPMNGHNLLKLGLAETWLVKRTGN